MDKIKMNSKECCFRTTEEPFSKVVWEVTFKCSLKCPYCFQERTKHRDKNSQLELRNIYQQVYKLLAHIRPKHVILSGGEPLVIGEDLIEIINKIKSLGATFSLSTTGFPRKFFVRALDQGPTTINVSIDPPGMLGEKYRYRKTKFETLKKTLHEIADREIPVKVTSLITKENLKNIPTYTDMLQGLFVEIPSLRMVYITNPYHIGYSRPDLSVKPEEVTKFVSTVNKLRDGSVNIEFINFSAASMPLQQCPAAKSIFCILPNGDIVGCPFLYQCCNSFMVGNVLCNQPQEIQMALERFATNVTKNVEQLLLQTQECHDCPVRAKCAGGCFAETFAMKETSIPALLCKRTIERSVGRNGALTSVPVRIRTKLTTGHPKQHFKKKKLSKILEQKIADHVKTYMREASLDPAHRYDHIKCVVKLAKHIAQQEGANMRIVVPAAYFHDFSSRQHNAFHFHTDESADAAADFLSSNRFDDDEIVAIIHCIVASSFSSSLLGIEPHTLEAEVVRDADWLEAMGARGIARVFSFGGEHCKDIGKLNFNPKNPKFVHHNIMAPDENSIQHFAAKLLLLNDQLLTKTGQLLGKKRHKFMVDFLLRFQKEMDVKA